MLERLVLIADEYGRIVDTIPWLEGDFTIGEINSFDLSVPKDLGIKQDYYLIVDESEYGGIVDDVDDDSLEDYLQVGGRTWQGILKDSTARPDSGQTHVVVSGDLNVIIGQLIGKFCESNMIVGSSELSGFTVTNYKMLGSNGDRFFDLYTGFRVMATSVGAKLKFTYDAKLRKCVCSVVERKSHINDGLDGEVVPVRVKITRPYNHYLCTGAGEGASRITCDVYADANGVCSDKQTIFGAQHKCKVYENVNCDTIEDLRKYGLENLADQQKEIKSCSLSGNVADDYDIDDEVGARSINQGVEIITYIAEKIATFDEDSNLSFQTKTALEVN